MRLIDADELKELLKEYQAECLKNPSEIMEVLYGGLGAILDVIDQQSTIDPVKHGKWEKCGYKWECSVCKARINIDGTPIENNLWFCSNCGAKMDGESV